MIGFHSVIDRPEPVKRVIPPSNTCIIIMKIPTSNQVATGLDDRSICNLFVIAGAKVVLHRRVDIILWIIIWSLPPAHRFSSIIFVVKNGRC